MKKVILLLLFLVAVSVLFAQPTYVKNKTTTERPTVARTRNFESEIRPKVAGARNFESETRPQIAAAQEQSTSNTVLYASPTSIGRGVEEHIQQAVNTRPSSSNERVSTISTASGPCENAPTVTFDGETLKLDCNRKRNYESFIVNSYEWKEEGKVMFNSKIQIYWYPDYLKTKWNGKTERDTDISSWQKTWGNYPGHQKFSLSNGNVIVSHTYKDNSDGFNLYDVVWIYRTFNLGGNQGGNIKFTIWAPKEVQGNKDKWEAWRAEMVDKAVAWPIPTPYK